MTKRSILEYLMILTGCTIVSLGFVFFINPYQFVPGGVFGTSIVLHYLMPQLQVGTYGYMLSIPLLVLSYFLLGKGIGARTLFATLASPFIMNVISSLAYPSAEALQRLSPAELCGGSVNLSQNLLLPAIFGPVLIGVGSAFIMKGKATSGGTDIVAMIIHKYLRVRFSTALLCVDGVIVCFGIAVIGLEQGLYSLICIFLLSRSLAYAMSGSKNKKILFIVTRKNNADLRDYILHTLDRTATALDSEGLYSQQPKSTYLMMVRMREVEAITSAIKALDPDAFIIVTDAYDAYGTRWKAFPDKHSIEIR